MNDQESNHRVLRTQLAKALTGITGFDEITGGGLPRALSSLQLKALGFAGGYLLSPVSGGIPAVDQCLVGARGKSEQTCW